MAALRLLLFCAAALAVGYVLVVGFGLRGPGLLVVCLFVGGAFMAVYMLTGGGRRR